MDGILRGSVGNTGMYSETFDMFINELLNKKDENYPGALNKVYNNSKMLSADVDAGYDPIYKSASEINNANPFICNPISLIIWIKWFIFYLLSMGDN